MTSYPPKFQGDHDHDRFRLRSVRNDESEPTLHTNSHEGKSYRQQNYEEHPVRRIHLQQGEDTHHRRAHLQQDEEIRNLSFFKRLNVPEGNIEEEVEWQDRQSPINFILIAGILFIFASVGWFGYRWYTTNTQGHPPIIQPEHGPFKVRPENPGGTVFPHEDKLIYNRLTPGQYQPAERLLPPPEQPQPIHPSGPDQQGYYPPSYPQQGQAPVYPQQQGYPYPDQQAQQPYSETTPYPPQQMQPGAYPPQPEYMDPYQGPPPQHPYYQGHPQPYPQQESYPQQATGQPSSEPSYSPQPVVAPTQPPYYQRQPAPYPPHQAYGGQQTPSPVMAPNPPSQGQDYQRRPQPETREDYDKTGLNSLLSEDDGTPKTNVRKRSEERETASKSQRSDHKTAASQSAPPNKGQYVVQVATFSEKSTAQSEIKRLIRIEPKLFKGKKFAIQYLELGPSKKPVYRVIIGPFETSNLAAQFRGRLKVHNIKGIVIKLAEPQ